MVEKNNYYNVVVIGAGVSGASLLYMLSNYTSIDNMAIIEKEESPGRVNSKANNNSQTLHEGDIETNYSLEKATKVKKAATFTKEYVEKKNNKDLAVKTPKMVLGIGENQIQLLKERYNNFKELFPTLEKLTREELKKVEPKIVEGRDENEQILGLYNKQGYTINYGKMAEELYSDSVTTNKSIDSYFSTQVKSAEKTKNGYKITLNNDKIIYSKFLVFATGAHSLLFAKSMGYGKNYSLLSVAGNFYFAPQLLNGKVYTIQEEKLPFAAVHGDPDIENNLTRFGPTTNIVFMLERHRYNSVLPYFKTTGINYRSISSFFNIIMDKVLFFYALKHNLLFRIPGVGKRKFLKEAQSVIPSLKYHELEVAKGYGGVRPQIVNTDTKSLEMGEARLGDKDILFNVTPSPGASTAISNAFYDTFKILHYFNKDEDFNYKKFAKNFPKSYSNIKDDI